MHAVLTFAFALIVAAPYEIVDNKLVLPDRVVFETATDRLKPESDATLEHVRGYLADKTYISTLRIEGHTDDRGDAGANQAISEKRAMAIAKWLVDKGVDCKRLLPVGFGSSKPIAANDSDEGRAQNRRMDFVNAALRGRAIGGMPLDGGGVVAGDPCQ